MLDLSGEGLEEISSAFLHAESSSNDADNSTEPLVELVLIEADGSAGLPCKGWLDTEPVVVPFTTHTVGVVTLHALGKPANAQTVLRPVEFERLTGVALGQIITGNAMVRMVDGMFERSVGMKALLLNCGEGEPAKQFLNRPELLQYFDALAYGSARENTWTGVNTL